MTAPIARLERLGFVAISTGVISCGNMQGVTPLASRPRSRWGPEIFVPDSVTNKMRRARRGKRHVKSQRDATP
jgi:hypothetical protein